MDSTHTMSSREREALKTPKDRLDELSYLMTHTISCFITDAPSILVQSWADQHISFESGNKSFGLKVDLKAPPIEGEPKNIVEAFHHQFANIGEWAFGEAVGDLVAIPATLAVQRLAPELMDTIRMPLEGIFGSFYRDAAEKQAAHWAEKHGIDEFSKEYHDYKAQHYESEMQKLPQAFVWTVVSMGAGAAAQKELAPMINSEWGNDSSYGQILRSSIIGKAITAVAANAPRTMLPEFSEKMDHFVRDNIAKPTSAIFGGGHEVETFDEYQQQHHK